METVVSRRTCRLCVYSLLFLASLNAVIFIAVHPLDWQQPETIRLRYYGLQAGLKEGPLTSRIKSVDFLKPFVNRAQGGEYESRYPAVLLDGLLAKLHQPFYRLLGTFLKEPVNILLTAVTAIFIFLAVKAFFSSVSAAALATAFWLLTSQVLLDLCYPVRLNMILSGLMSAFILWRLAVLPEVLPRWRSLIWMLFAFLLGFHSHETILCLIPVCGLIVFSRRPRYRGWGLKLSILGLLAALSVFFNMFILVPRLVEITTGNPPPWTWIDDSITGLLFNLNSLGQRIREYVFVGAVHLLRQEGGMSAMFPPWTQIIGGLATLSLLILSGLRGLKIAWAFLAGFRWSNLHDQCSLSVITDFHTMYNIGHPGSIKHA